MESLNCTEMDMKDLRTIQNLYWEHKAVVPLQNGNSEVFNIERGVRQGCVLSPKLFNLYTEPIFRVLEELPGLSVGGGEGGGTYITFNMQMTRHWLQTVKKNCRKS